MRGEEGDGTRFVELAGKIAPPDNCLVENNIGRSKHRNKCESSGVLSFRWFFVESMRQCISVTQTSGSIFNKRDAESTYRQMLGSQPPRSPPLDKDRDEMVVICSVKLPRYQKRLKQRSASSTPHPV